MKGPLRFLSSIALSVSLLCMHAVTSSAADHNRSTDWMSEAGVGAFMHFLTNASNFDLVDSFDVKALADQLEEMGAGWFVLTLGQNSGYYNAPNPVYDEISGYKAGERTSHRDLPMELSKELRKRGIRFMLYLPCQTPNRDLQAVVNYGFPKDNVDNDRQLTPAGTDNWAKTIAWWSKHYGKKVSGWWFDGGYEWCGFDETIGKKYADAAKAGNRKSIVAMNPGIVPECKRNVQAEDYTAGEANDFLPMHIDGRWTDGAQNHILTFLGSSWGKRDCRISTDEIVLWLKEILSKGGAVTFDMGPNYDPAAGPVGTFSEEQFQQMKAICHSCRNGK